MGRAVAFRGRRAVKDDGFVHDEQGRLCYRVVDQVPYMSLCVMASAKSFIARRPKRVVVDVLKMLEEVAWELWWLENLKTY